MTDLPKHRQTPLDQPLPLPVLMRAGGRFGVRGWEGVSGCYRNKIGFRLKGGGGLLFFTCAAAGNCPERHARESRNEFARFEVRNLTISVRASLRVLFCSTQMPILNYTTQIAAEKTVAEIQQMLAKAKAQAIMSEYRDGILSAISFRIGTQHGMMSFRLPCDVQKIYQVMVRQKVTPKLCTKEQAARVSWRILKDWLAAQLALIAAEMADLEQVFLPYAQDETGATLYEVLKDRNFTGLALPAPATT